MDPRLNFPGRSSDPLCEKEGRRIILVCGLPTIERIHDQRLDATTIDQRVPGSTK